MLSKHRQGSISFPWRVAWGAQKKNGLPPGQAKQTLWAKTSNKTHTSRRHSTMSWLQMVITLLSGKKQIFKWLFPTTITECFLDIILKNATSKYFSFFYGISDNLFFILLICEQSGFGRKIWHIQFQQFPALTLENTAIWQHTLFFLSFLRISGPAGGMRNWTNGLFQNVWSDTVSN